jgi:hypothetical protein
MVSRNYRLVALIAVLLVLAYVAYVSLRPSGVGSTVANANNAFVPLAVENPALRLDLLANLKKLEYTGSQRNIFSATPPPPPPKPAPAVAAPVGPVVPPPPPPLAIPATFFGYVADASTGTKRAFFNSGDDVFVLGVGDLLLGRFRLLQIGASTAELEETSSGRRATLTLEEPGPS